MNRDIIQNYTVNLPEESEQIEQPEPPQNQPEDHSILAAICVVEFVLLITAILYIWGYLGQ